MKEHTDVILFDMAQLAFSRVGDGLLLRVEIANVGILAEVPLRKATSHREGIFEALDSMLATLEVPSSRGRWRKAALYNPLTAQVAFKAVPETVVYTDGRPLTIPAYGLQGALDDEVLRLDGRELPRLVADSRSTRTALAAHS